ncbi:putative ribonuclease H-like domain-containing protein [Tanacetum coccineum]
MLISYYVAPCVSALAGCDNDGQSEEKNVSTQQYIVFLFWSSISSSYKSSDEKYKNDTVDDAAGKTPVQKLTRNATRANSTNSFNTVSTPVNAASAPRTFNDALPSFVPLGGSFPLAVNDPPDDHLMPDLEDTAEVQNTGIFGSAYDNDDLDTYNSPYADQVVGAEADFNNIEPSTVVSSIPITRVHSINPKNQIFRDPRSVVQTRGMLKKNFGEHEPTKIAQAFDDESWVEAMQEELLQFKIQKVWTLVDLPYGKKAIGTKWVYRNKNDERGIVVRNKDRLMDVKSAFLYGTIEEEVYVSQPLGFADLEFLEKVYKVEKALYGLHQAPRACIRTSNTPMKTNKALTKDEDGEDVDVHLYKSMIVSLMYLTSSRLDIMFSVCACSRFQVHPKVSHLNTVKRIFRYLKGRPKLGLWYPKDSPFILETFSDSDYASSSLDKKSTTGGCQFLGSRLIS